MIPEDNIIILANRRSRGYRDVYRRHLLKVFAKRRNAPIYYLSPKNGDLFSSIQSEIDSAQQIIIAGGDGTFESALNYKPLQSKSLGFFPLGAGNCFYSYFYKGKRFEYLRSRFEFREIDIDVLELKLDHQKILTFFLSAGVDAEVIRLAKERTHNGFFDYVSASWKALLTGKASFDIQCSADDTTYHWKNSINITLGKIPYHGFGVRSLLGRPVPDDGQVYGLAYVSNHSPIFNKLLRLWGLMLTTFRLRWMPLFPFRGKEVAVQSETSFPVQAGGEFLGYSKSLNVKVQRKQKVLVI